MGHHTQPLVQHVEGMVVYTVREWTAAQTADTQEMRDAAAASYMDSHHRATHRATQSGNTLSNRSHNTAHNCVVQPNTETGMQQTDGSEADDW